MQEEWEDVYANHVEAVFRYLMCFLGHREDALDLSQETFVKAFGRWKSFTGSSSLRTWLIAIAHNLAVDRVRKAERQRLLQKLLRQQPTQGVEMPEEIAQMNEARQELYLHIRHLKADHRAVVALRGLQEFSVQEAADILGWTESKVKVTYHRAIKSLSGHYKEGEQNVYEVV
ncbi:RNA polymerase sigma factor [Tumebacillus sp. ITR2]|uniref:RNA polymerase sigma factor n=1 Tax=Tumebacillus amylolyticus TaxID=2801339 RepID=A0ABS1JAX6_9BACL|nr:RNA polymerase sigma factor [Tumebacillus amylolyticus]MBL0387429.1 RNA polymerase sigma factor [Tumebacillus amylolyticus]